MIGHITCIGSSHVGALIRAIKLGGYEQRWGFVNLTKLHDGGVWERRVGPSIDPVLDAIIGDAIGGKPNEYVTFLGSRSELPNPIVLSSIGGNVHNLMGLLEHEKPFDFIVPNRPELPLLSGSRVIPFGTLKAEMERRMEWQLSLLSHLSHKARTQGIRLTHIESPPPIESNEHIFASLDRAEVDSVQNLKVANKYLRLKLWLLHSQIMFEASEKADVDFIRVPDGSLDAEQFLRRDYWPKNNGTHANAEYGRLVIAQILNKFNVAP